MLFRALLLLAIVIGLSIWATVAFGHEVLIALGLILAQLQVLFHKVMAVRLPAVLAWIKAHGTVFLRKDLWMKWVSGSLFPMVLGNAVLRRISAFVMAYTAGVRDRYARLLAWYEDLGRIEKTLAALIILFATIALTVSTLGLWLILFSVKLPLWVAAAVAGIWTSMRKSIEKSVFKTLAFLQLGWVWSAIKARLPASWLQRKRRFDYRLARSIIRRRRLTVRELAARKDRLPFRLGVLVEVLFTAPRTGGE